MKTISILFLSVIATVITSSCCSLCPNPTVCNPDPNGIGLISENTSKFLTQNYRDNLSNNSIVDQDILKKESQSVWFSYDEMSKYLCVLINEYKNTKSEEVDMSKLGIRVYFGRYPNLEDTAVIERFPDLRDVQNERNVSNNNSAQVLSEAERIKSYTNKNCVFFVPTIDKLNNNGTYHQDFMLEQLVTNPKAPSAVWLLNKNHGNLAPPDKIDGAEYLLH